MIDSTESGHVVHQRAAGSAELMVEADTGREAQKALGDALPDAGKGTRAVALEGQDVFAGL